MLGLVAFASLQLALGRASLVRQLGFDPLDLETSSAGELSWLGSAPWAKVALIITVAVFVLMFGGVLAKRGTRRGSALGGRRDFSLEVARLESLPATPIAEAHDGPVHFEGTLSSASETLGGEPGKERVYFNRAGAGRRSAVASELVLLRDATGQVSIEGLENARVIAAKERKGGRHDAPDTISLRLGDRVQLLGHFRSELHGRDEAPEERVYGVIGDGQQIQVRVLAAPSEAAKDGEAVGDPAAASVESPAAAAEATPTTPDDAPSKLDPLAP